MVVTTAAATMYKRPFWEQAPDEPAPWWSKRAKGDAPPPAGGGDNQAALLQLLAEKGKRNGELRAALDRRQEELLAAREDARVARVEVASLTEQVASLQSMACEEVATVAHAEALEAAAKIFEKRAVTQASPGKRGRARQGAERAGLPTCETIDLPFRKVAFFKRAKINDPYDLKFAIVALKSPDGRHAPAELRTVSAYQARDAALVFRMRDAPWKRGCVSSFLEYMASREFEDTRAKDRRHWMCMKLWPGRFATPDDYLRHEACMSKAGKFVTSVGKLRAVYERDLAGRE